MIGKTVSHYTILEHLGGGGMGVVYKAEDTRLKRTVALKFLPPDLTRDPEAKERFIHEAQAASALQHHNICVVHDIDETPDGQLFIVMEYLEGETLKTRIERGPLPIEEAAELAMQVARGLAKAHGAGMAHRDIKPANIMVTNEGDAKVVDFGLAKLAGQTRLTKPGSTLGTVAYMSPEQARGEQADHRSDIWSLGVTLYEMVTGQSPFKGDYENAVVYSIQNAQPEPVTALRTGVPIELERIIDKAMAKDPSDRYQHADELLVDLRHVRKPGGPITIPPTAMVERKPGTRLRWKKIAVPTLLALGLIAAFLLLKPALFEEILVSEPKPIAVITFANQTGDKSYDYLQEAIPNLLITSLEQSRYVRVMTWERMHDILKQIGRKDAQVIDRDLGFEICRREGIHAIVLGSYVKAGETFATDVKLLDVNTKELLKSASARGEGVQSILNSQIDELSREIAHGVGLSQRRIESYAPQIAEVTTSSMDAYNYFLRGREDYEKLYYREAQQFLENAIGLDSTFAVAYFYLSETLNALLEPESRTAIEKAMALSFKAPEKERLLIEALYANAVERNPSKRQLLLEELTTKYPMEKRFHEELAAHYRSRGRTSDAQYEVERALRLDPDYAAAVNHLAYIYADQELYDKAVETFQRYASLSPGDANPFDSMAELYLKMGKLDESIARYSEAVRVQPSFHSAYRSLAYVYALKEDYDRCLQWIDSLFKTAPSTGLKAEAAAWKVMYLELLGRSRESVRWIAIMSDLAESVGPTVFSAPLHWVKGWSAFNRGEFKASRHHFAAFHEIYARDFPKTPVYNDVQLNIILSFVDLRTGQTDSARSRFARLKPQLGSIESRRGMLPMLAGILEGELLLAEGLPDSAIHVYRETPVIGPSMSVGWWMPMYNIPRLRDVVPRALQAKGELDGAIAEYERLIRIDPNTKDRRFINPKYHYRLARLYEETGRMDKATMGFRKFLEVWKDADKHQPELIDARRRVAATARTGSNSRM